MRRDSSGTRLRTRFASSSLLSLVVIAIALFVVLAPGSTLHAELLVPRGATWRYLKGTSAASSPVFAWRQRGFDDSLWTSGSTPFRYGDGDGGTELADMRGSYSTVYLRRTFDLVAGNIPRTLRLNVDFDDGFTVWINGVEAHQVNGPPSPRFDSVSTTSHESGSFESFVLDDPEGLVPGENVIAVQGFNAVLGSSDFLIHVELESVARVADTRFSRDRGFHAEPFPVEITTATPGATIRYTTDGSPPSETVGTVYTGPLTISSTTVLRAMAFRDGMEPTNVDTHTYIFVEDVLRQPREIEGWPLYEYTSGTGSPASHDYEMDPEIVEDPSYRDAIALALTSIPTICLSMDRDVFWGVYRGSAEELVSMELLYPDAPEQSQQIDAEILRHSHNRVKNSFRLRFKKELGAAKFDSEIFRRAVRNGESAVDEFDRLVLRAGNNRSWARNFNDGRCAYTRDQWYRDTQIEMNGHGVHGVFVHLYIDGIYWGLYNPVEKPDAWFASAYFGGEREDWWDSAGHGDATRWDHLRGALKDRDMSVAANYDELREHLDVTGFSDYLLLTWMTGMTDWPGNNWQAMQRNVPTAPLRYFGWDCEWSWDTTAGSNLGAWVHPDFRRNSRGGQTIAALWNSARRSDDFLVLFADRVYRSCANDGALTDARSRERWSVLNDHIREAMIAESARWGDASRPRPYTRDVTWQNEVDRLDGLMNGNVSRFLTALRAEGYYPDIDPPRFRIDGSILEVSELRVDAGAEVLVERDGLDGEIYFTLDGSDPRAPGGTIAASARAGGASTMVAINAPTRLRARTLDGDVWSALHEVIFHVRQDLSSLRFSEIMYHPPDALDAEGVVVGGKQLEFLELENTGGLELDLSGLRFTRGVTYGFPFGTRLAPGQFLVLVSNESAFATRYRGVEIRGVFGQSLSNGGETIELGDFEGLSVLAMTYDDRLPWPLEADGAGHSLVPAIRDGSPDDPRSWRASATRLGSPGVADPLLVGEFVRGDSSGDLAVDISDAIHILLVLFGGQANDGCQDARDVNDDGRINLSDPISLLEFLFRAGARPPPPYPDAGRDPTPDELSCESPDV